MNMEEMWYGFRSEKLLFEGQEAVIVYPEEGTSNGYLALKTVYWGAFPEACEIDLLKKGFHLCFVLNKSRWGLNEDLDRMARFVRHVQSENHLKEKCVPVGMSCGGLMAIKFAARYPELIACLYLDAPVVNYMSCPCGFGIGDALSETNDEILNDLGMKSVSELMSYREMPLDMIPGLIAERIPVIMVAGDSDHVVPFCENGINIQKAYKDAGIEIEVYLKPGCDHHPHGLSDPSPVIDFILRHCS